jgi:hypothetical protein
MGTLEAVAVVTSLFAARFVVPLLLTLAIGYMLSRASARGATADEEARPRIT